MRYALHVALAVMSAVGFAANAADGCVGYGDRNTDFTWRLCPAGAKFERQYYYFGVWSSFYPVSSDAGACTWSPARSSWMCPDRMIRCDARRCG